jgi:hypothetical protein
MTLEVTAAAVTDPFYCFPKQSRSLRQMTQPIFSLSLSLSRFFLQLSRKTDKLVKNHPMRKIYNTHLKGTKNGAKYVSKGLFHAAGTNL